MREKKGRKPPQKGLPFTAAELQDIACRLRHPELLKPPAEISLQDWADLVNSEWRIRRRHIAGFLLDVAKRMVPHGQWGRLFKKHPQAVGSPLRMSDRTAERLISIARRPWLLDSTHGSNLPPSWRTLAELTRFTLSGVEYLLANGHLSPKTMRAEVSWWLAGIRAQERNKATEKGSHENRPPHLA